MNQEERLEYLLKELCSESIQYKNLKVNSQDKRYILRALMNIRLPKPISNEFLEIQDEFLKKEAIDKGIIKLSDINTLSGEYTSENAFADKISIWQGDITRLQVDAIVNAANSQMLGCFVPCHKCIDNAIHSAAGIQLRNECHNYMENKRKSNAYYEEPVGKAMLTSAYNLPCKYIIHTVGPIVTIKLTDSLKRDLHSAYESVLNKVIENKIRSIAFCCISTGEFNFPNYEAANIAIDTVNEFLKDKKSLETIYKAGADKANYMANKTLRKVQKKIGLIPR